MEGLVINVSVVQVFPLKFYLRSPAATNPAPRGRRVYSLKRHDPGVRRLPSFPDFAVEDCGLIFMLKNEIRK